MFRRRRPCPTAAAAPSASRDDTTAIVAVLSSLDAVGVASGAMLVGVDARALAARRGVARYTRRMVEALAALDGVAVRALVPGRQEVEAVAGVELRRTRAPSRLLHLAGAVAGRPRVDTLLGGPEVDITW